MKTIKSFTALAIAAATMILFTSKASAQEIAVSFDNETTDSLEFVSQSSNSHPGGWNFDFIGLNVSSKKGHYRSYLPTLTFFSGWGFGVSSALNAPVDVDINVGRSFNFCIEDVVAIRMRPWKTGTFSLGYGFDLRNYRMTGDMRFIENPDSKKIYTADYPGNTVPNYSKIRTFSNTFNLKYIQYLGKGFRLAFGPEVTLLGKGNKQKIVTNYYDNNDNNNDGKKDGEQELKTKKIKANKVGLNLVGVLNYKNLFGVYAKYSPSSVLNPAFGPEFNTVSFGVMLFGL